MQWCACTKCTNCQFKHITDQERHTKHHTKYHNGKKCKTPDINNEEVTVDDDDELTYSVMPDTHHADSQPKFSTKVGMCGGANTSLDYSIYGNPNSANFLPGSWQIYNLACLVLLHNPNLVLPIWQMFFPPVTYLLSCIYLSLSTA